MVTAVLYTSYKFYPDARLVSDPRVALAEVFVGNTTNLEPTKLVSLVTEISYVGAGESVTLGEGEGIVLSYIVEV